MLSNYSDDVEEIDISNNRLTQLPDLSRFKKLQTLYCYNNQLTSLPPLPSTLQTFYCSNNQLTSLPPFPSTLQILDCSCNQLIHLPPFPSTLQRLYCFRNQLTHLPSLPSSLQYLDCSNNSFSLPLTKRKQWKFYSGFSQLKRIYQKDLAKKIQKKWRNYWDEPYKTIQWEDGTNTPICRSQENYFNEFNQNFL